MPTRNKAAKESAAIAPALPTTANIERLRRPVKRATRPKTKSPRCCEGVRPMSQSFSENPGIAVPPILRHAEDGRGARQDQQEREDSEDDQEEPREHVDVFHEDRGGEEPEDEEEHAPMARERSRDEAEALPGGDGLRRFGTRNPRSEEHTSELQSQFHLVC